MALDIGYILFVDILQMSQYPGSPFTGNIVQDLVMFFFIPTVFIIIFIWQLVGRLMSGAPKSLGFLLGIAFYLFIVFQGLYAVFALLTGPYFLFLIFVYGLIFYFIGHFGVSRSEDIVETGRMPGAAYKKAKSMLPGNIKEILGVPEISPAQRRLIERELRYVDQAIERLEQRMDKMDKMQNPQDYGKVALELEARQAERDMLMRRLHGRIPGRRS